MKMAQFLLIITLCASIAFLQLSDGVDTLFPNQTFAIGHTLISRNQVFEMGFFTPGKPPNRFLGIWYKGTPQVVAWVANRNDPITDSRGVAFSISRNGTLVISRGGSVIWSSNASGMASNPVLQLLDTGNLVLSNETMEGSSERYMWQSFDYPTDTLLPGLKLVNDIDTGVETYLTSWRSSDDPSPGDFSLRIENQGLPQVMVYRGNMKTFRTGTWNGVFFSGILPFPNRLEPDVVFNAEKLISIAEPYDSSMIFRVKLDASGFVHSYMMNARRNKWNSAFTSPKDTCGEYGVCGPNGICRIDNTMRCQCLKGFAPKFPKDWNLQDWTAGCTRITPLNCEGGDGFQEVRGVMYPDMLAYWLNTSMNLADCKSQCLKNCSCTAYANPYVTNGGSGSVMWFGDLIDTRGHSGADSMQHIYIRLPVSELVEDFSEDLEKEKKKSPTKLILVMSTAIGVLVSGFINGGVFFMTRRRRLATKMNNEDLELPLFKFAAIVAATNNFSKENMIGEGGFGPVYKGDLPSGEEIAIKRLSRTSGQGLEEFKNEVILLLNFNIQTLLDCWDVALKVKKGF